MLEHGLWLIFHNVTFIYIFLTEKKKKKQKTTKTLYKSWHISLKPKDELKYLFVYFSSAVCLLLCMYLEATQEN